MVELEGGAERHSLNGSKKKSDGSGNLKINTWVQQRKESLSRMTRSRDKIEAKAL